MKNSTVDFQIFFDETKRFFGLKSYNISNGGNMIKNTKTKVGNYKVETTMKMVSVYQNGKLVGSAGVQNPKDFDFDALFHIALHKSGSKIEVA